MRTCAADQALTGMRANVVPDMGTFGDDLGMDNLQMICSDGQYLDGLYGDSNGTAPNRKYKVGSFLNTVINKCYLKTRKYIPVAHKYRRLHKALSASSFKICVCVCV